MSQVSLLMFVLYIFSAALVMAAPQSAYQTIAGLTYPGSDQVQNVPGVKNAMQAVYQNPVMQQLDNGISSNPYAKQITGAVKGGADQLNTGISSVPGASAMGDLTKNIPGYTGATDAIKNLPTTDLQGCPIVSQLGNGPSSIPGVDQITKVISVPVTQVSNNIVQNDDPEATQL